MNGKMRSIAGCSTWAIGSSSTLLQQHPKVRRIPRSSGSCSNSNSRIPIRRHNHYDATKSVEPEQDVSVQLREIMRDVAQPVAVAVARVPSSISSSPSKYHGATLTSFTSLTLHPFPLVAFSLRLPSRLADCLRPWITPSPSPSPSSSESIPKTPPLTISLLSRSNEPIADTLSKRQPDQSPIFANQSIWNNTSPPGLIHSMGSLRCEVVSSIPLCDICGTSTSNSPPSGHDHPAQEGSELFICKVVEVIRGKGEDPLLHWRRRYVGIKNGIKEDKES